MTTKLSPGLAILYNGRYVRNALKESSSIKGVILTDNGELYARDLKSEQWDHIRTPKTFYFYDIHSKLIYVVSGQSIKPTELHEGRFLDCTDQAIYDIIDNEWCPIYDLGNRKTTEIVRAQTVIGDEFEVRGNPIQVVPELSQINPFEVDLERGFIQGNSLAPGESKTLVYTTELENKKTTVIEVLTRPKIKPRFSAVAGNLEITINDIPTPEYKEYAGLVQINRNLYQLVDWELLIDNDTFNIVTGSWTVSQSGDYQIAANIGLLPLTDSGQEERPWLALVVYSSMQENGIVKGSAMVFERNASLNICLRLSQNTVVVLYLVANQLFETIPSMVTFNAHLIGD